MSADRRRQQVSVMDQKMFAEREKNPKNEEAIKLFSPKAYRPIFFVVCSKMDLSCIDQRKRIQLLTQKTRKNEKNEKCNHFEKKAILRHQFFFVDAAAVTVC